MTFAQAWVLHFLWLIPLVGLALLAHHRRRGQALARFAEPELLARLTGGVVPGMRAMKVVLVLFALGLMIFSLSGPRWGSHYQEVTQKGVDIVLLADVSPSMLVEDVEPNRLERARREILDFLRVVQGDRVGLVAFSGAAYVQCPLTLDYAALEMFLQALHPDLIPTSGTDLGAAIETGLTAFDPKAETDKVMLLITDGEDNEGRGLDAARTAAHKGVKIFVFGVGAAGGGPVPGDRGGFKKDERGNMVLSRMDEASLQRIAAETGGTYVRSVAGDLDLDVLYFDGIRSRTTAQTLKSGKIRIEEERFFLFLVPAFLLLLIEGFLAERRPFRPTALLLLLLAGNLAGSGRAQAAEDPDQLYRAGRFAEAEKAYAELDLEHPKDVRYRYDRGCAAYQRGDYQAAAAAFSSASVRAGDDALRFKAVYNLGNAVFQKGDYAAAADLYRNALRIDPASGDARHNLELSLRKLEQQRQDQKKQDEQKKSDEQRQAPAETGRRPAGVVRRGTPGRRQRRRRKVPGPLRRTEAAQRTPGKRAAGSGGETRGLLHGEADGGGAAGQCPRGPVARAPAGCRAAPRRPFGQGLVAVREAPRIGSARRPGRGLRAGPRVSGARRGEPGLEPRSVRGHPGRRRAAVGQRFRRPRGATVRPVVQGFDDFLVRPAGTSTRVEIVNGRYSAGTDFSFVIQPKNAGIFRIGPAQVTLDGTTYGSNVATLTVEPAAASPAGDRGPVFLVAALTPGKLYAGTAGAVHAQALPLGEHRRCVRQRPRAGGGHACEARGAARVPGAAPGAGLPDRRGALSRDAAKDRKPHVAADPDGTDRVHAAESPRRGIFDDPFFGQRAAGRPQTLTSEALPFQVLPLPQAGRPADFGGLVGTSPWRRRSSRGNSRRGSRRP